MTDEPDKRRLRSILRDTDFQGLIDRMERDITRQVMTAKVDDDANELRREYHALRKIRSRLNAAAAEADREDGKT